jgi:hypothetical protein|tara:strand:- start:13 stop:318 length:306 start_codon:yes stop_codon:yes gene_type:complete
MTNKTIESLYLYEKYVRPLEKQADAQQAKLSKVNEEKDWIDKCLRPIPISDYAHFKARERDINDSPNVEQLVLAPNYLLMQSCLYFFIWYSLPLLILIYLA